MILPSKLHRIRFSSFPIFRHNLTHHDIIWLHYQVIFLLAISILRFWFKISFDWSLNLSVSPRRQLHLRSNNMITMRWKWLEMLLLFSFRYSCWEVCIAANRPFARWRHFTTRTRILQGFAFLFKLQLILLKPHWEYQI